MDKAKGYVVAGIDTEIGKTLISAILVQKLGAAYWKPVQSGDLHHTDTDKVKALVSHPEAHFLPEAFRLSQPMSPHAAADIDDIQLHRRDFDLPTRDRPLIVELAGGLMVPLSPKLLNLDLLREWQLPVILVSRYYLGSINHTLLSTTVLQQAGIPIHGLVLNGDSVASTKEVILSYTDLPLLGEIPQLAQISPESILDLTEKIQL